MTERLYYTDSHLRAFSAAVVASDDGGHRVVLDRTAFYPTSGGQPHDTGTLNDARVLDVVDEDHRVVHLLDRPLDVGTVVAGSVHWPRRWDHMQQHSGQHLLSGVFESVHGWSTVSVAFGAEVSSVELATTGVSPAVLADVELRANAIVCEDREVAVTFESADEASRRLRKPSDRTGLLRIVTIDDLDVSACGGTHVRRTGEIGAILLGKTERVRDHVRVQFWCGARAIARARRDQETLSAVAAALSAAPHELPSLVPAQAEELRALRKDRDRLAAQLAVHEAEAAWQAARPRADGVRVLVVRRDADAADAVKAFAQAAARKSQTLVVAVAGTTVIVAASPDSGVQAGALLKPLLTEFGGRGGGSPALAQGTVADAAAAEALVTRLSA